MNRSRFVGLMGVPLSILLSLAVADAQTLPAAKSQSASVRTPVAVESNAAFRAAGEPFEKLTETAFDAPWRALDQTIGEATAAAKKMRSSLSLAEAARLDAQLSAIRIARQKQDRAGLALASIEGYRILVSAVTANAQVPTEVSLLDYAGFRYDADLKSKPVRWDDMVQAVVFARKTAEVLAPKIPSPALAASVDKIILAMEQAANDRNTALAASSVKSLLNLVDQLERAFLVTSR